MKQMLGALLDTGTNAIGRIKYNRYKLLTFVLAALVIANALGITGWTVNTVTGLEINLPGQGWTAPPPDNPEGPEDCPDGYIFEDSVHGDPECIPEPPCYEERETVEEALREYISVLQNQLLKQTEIDNTQSEANDIEQQMEQLKTNITNAAGTSGGETMEDMFGTVVGMIPGASQVMGLLDLIAAADEYGDVSDIEQVEDWIEERDNLGDELDEKLEEIEDLEEELSDLEDDVENAEAESEDAQEALEECLNAAD